MLNVIQFSTLQYVKYSLLTTLNCKVTVYNIGSSSLRKYLRQTNSTILYLSEFLGENKG